MHMWSFVIDHWPDVIIAAVLAALFAAIFEFVPIGSGIRSAIRHFKNRLSESSVKRLRDRIASLERYRETVTMYMSSDKAQYLHTLGIVLAVLVCICAGVVAILLGTLGLVRDAGILALGIFAIGITVGVYGLKLASLDTRAKLSELVQKLDADIANLKAKLQPKLGTLL